MSKNTDISDRILLVIEYHNVNKNTFATKLGYPRSQTVYDIVNKKVRPSYDFFERFANSEFSEKININWLLTGTGEMLATLKDEKSIILEKNKKNIYPENDRPRCALKMTAQDSKMTAQDDHPTEETTTDNEAIYFNNSIQLNAPTLQSFPSLSNRPLERQQVPLYDIDARAGIVPILDGRSIPVDYISIPNLPKCDGGLNVRGDSMYPLLQSGDLVLFKNINDFKNIVYGEMYLISFHLNEEEYCVIKYLQKSRNKDTLNLTSHNDTHSVMEINKANIRALAIVKASVRYNTMV